MNARVPSGPDAARQEVARLVGQLRAASGHRARRALARRLGHVGAALAEDDAARRDAAAVAAGLQAIRLAQDNGAENEDLPRRAAVLTRARWDLGDSGEPAVLERASGTVLVRTGCLLVTGSADIEPDEWLGPERDVLDAMNRGRFLLIGTGTDGELPVELRVGTTTDPVLPADEYPDLVAATRVGSVLTPDGVLRFGAAEDVDSGPHVAVPGPRVAVQVFFVDRPDRGAVAVAGPADDGVSHLTSVPELHH